MANSSALYFEVYQKILNDIQHGEYPENTPLPAERFLCDKYHVSRSTIRQALQRLKEAEVVYSVQGNGTYVKPQIYTQPFSKFYSFTDTLKRSNVLIQNSIIDYSVIAADVSIAKRTGYPVGTAFHRVKRLRSAREYPLMLETTFLPVNRFISLDIEALQHGSLYEYLRQNYNFHVDKAAENFSPVMPLPDEKDLLKISPSTPCILLERFSYEGNFLIEYTKSIVRGDKYVFHIDWQNANE